MAQTVRHDASQAPAETDERTQRSRERIQQFIEQQGLKPVERFEDLLGDFWPEDESIDEFIATVRQWRRESDRNAL